MSQKIAKHRANDASNDVHRPPLVDLLAIFEVGIEPSLNQTCTAGPEPMYPSFWKLYR